MDRQAGTGYLTTRHARARQVHRVNVHWCKTCSRQHLHCVWTRSRVLKLASLRCKGVSRPKEEHIDVRLVARRGTAMRKLGGQRCCGPGLACHDMACHQHTPAICLRPSPSLPQPWRGQRQGGEAREARRGAVAVPPTQQARCRLEGMEDGVGRGDHTGVQLKLPAAAPFTVCARRKSLKPSSLTPIPRACKHSAAQHDAKLSGMMDAESARRQ